MDDVIGVIDLDGVKHINVEIKQVTDSAWEAYCLGDKSEEEICGVPVSDVNCPGFYFPAGDFGERDRVVWWKAACLLRGTGEIVGDDWALLDILTNVKFMYTKSNGIRFEKNLSITMRRCKLIDMLRSQSVKVPTPDQGCRVDLVYWKDGNLYTIPIRSNDCKGDTYEFDVNSPVVVTSVVKGIDYVTGYIKERLKEYQYEGQEEYLNELVVNN